MPVYKRDAVGQLRLYQRLLPKYWAVVNDDGTLRGLLPEELNAAFKQLDPTKDTDTQIMQTLDAMSAALKGRKVAYLEGGMKYELADGKLASAPSDAAAPMDYPVAHDVRPTAQALGAGGCTDCHSLASPFLGMVVPTDPDRSQTQQMHEQWGISSLAVGAGALREDFIKPYGPWLIPLTLLACLLHYVIFGAKIVKHDDPEDIISRFTTTERLLHFFQMATFVVLAATGLGFLASAAGWWSVPRGGLARSIHVTCGWVFIVSSLGFVLQQLRQGILRKYDREWFLTLGGYLWIKAEPPAGKFNAGQKLFYWLAAACAIGLGLTGLSMAYDLAPAGWDVYAWMLHDLAAAVLIPSVLGHLYLGTIANPGTIQAVFTGTVSRAWAKKHHSIWYEEVK
jgi:formate dehydrogenase subunit gamma